MYELLYFICPVIATRVFDSLGTISYGGHNFVGMGDSGFLNILVAKLSGVGEPLSVGCFDVANMCVLVLWQCGQVPSV